MTAEMAIMNREAVALAADSAVTVSSHRGQKIWNTANKLISLSKFEPVGIMIHGSASFCGVPWETIIKWYREERHAQSFGTLPEYVDDFRRFLESNLLLFPETERRETLEFELYYLMVNVKDRVRSRFNSSVPIPLSADVASIVASSFDEIALELEKYAPLSTVDFNTANDAVLQLIRDSTKFSEVLEDLPLPADFSTRLNRLAIAVATRDYFPHGLTGVVIAGFGRDDVYPRLRSFIPHIFVGSQLKRRTTNSADISSGNSGLIIPFAQRDMVDLFMRGIDVGLERLVSDYINTILDDLPGVLEPIPEPV